MGSSLISYQQLLAASNGNADLLNLLQQLKAASENSSAVTGTTPIAGQIAGEPNPAAPVPPQASGVVSILGGAYVVEITNPGAQNPISALQSAEATGKATSLTPLQPATTIFHQIRASTSPAFNVNSNTQTFGGNTGSTQTYWTLTGLGKGTWYVQFRSTYDGVNFNTWRNANGGTALGGLINQVTEENAGNANWALLTLPGSLIVGVGEGYLSDGGIFDLAEQIYSSGMFAVGGPNGYAPIGNSTYGTINCDVDLNTPSPLPPSTGIPDYPVELVMRYGQAHAAPAYWPGQATVFAIGFDPTNPNVTLYKDPLGTAAWAAMRLPGGASIAIGQGKNYDGDTIWLPPPSWVSASRLMSICSFTDATDSGYTPHGYYENQINAGALQAKYNDSQGHIWSTTANWLAIAWETGTDVQTVDGAPWLTINLQGGHAMAIGAGQQATVSAPVVLPSGYNATNMLGICTPGGYVDAGHHFQGILQCAFAGLFPTLIYQDDSYNTWSGVCNWFAACWK